jgi:hypothetical protein
MDHFESHHRQELNSSIAAAELIQKMDEVEHVLTEFESKAIERQHSSQRLLDLVHVNRWYIANIGIGFEKRHHLRRLLHSSVTEGQAGDVGDSIDSARFEYAIEFGHGLPRMIKSSVDQTRHNAFTEMQSGYRHH